MGKKWFLVLVAACLCGQAMGTIIWESDMSSLDGWGESSNAANEAGPTTGGIRVVGGENVQMNSWWDGAGYTNMWKDTGAVIQDEMVYWVSFRMTSYADGAPVSLTAKNVTSPSWLTLDEESVAPPTGDWQTFKLSFSTIGDQNSDAIGNTIGVGVSPGWWNNLAVDHISINEVPEPVTLAVLGLGGLGLLRRRKA